MQLWKNEKVFEIALSFTLGKCSISSIDTDKVCLNKISKICQLKIQYALNREQGTGAGGGGFSQVQFLATIIETRLVKAFVEQTSEWQGPAALPTLPLSKREKTNLSPVRTVALMGGNTKLFDPSEGFPRPPTQASVITMLDSWGGPCTVQELLLG